MHPVSLVGAVLGVEDDDPMVDIPIGHVHFSRTAINDHMSRAAEILGVVAPSVSSLPPDLHHERTVSRELQDVSVLRGATAEPNVTIIVNVNAVLEVGPLVAVARDLPTRTPRYPRGRTR